MANNDVQHNGDTEQLVNCKMRTVGTKRILAIIGLTSICLVIVLVLMLYAFDYDENVVNGQQQSAKFVETYIFKEFQTAAIKEDLRKRSIPEQSISKSVSDKFDRVERFKRQLPINSVYYAEQPVENTRQKRLSEHLQDVRMKFEQCKNSQSDPMECAKFYREMMEVSDALKQEIQSIGEIPRNFDSPDYAVGQENYENYGKFAQLPDVSGDTMHEFNREDKILQSANEFSPFPKFHEDLDTRQFNSWSESEPSRNPQDFSNFPKPPPITSMRSSPAVGSDGGNGNITPLKNSNFDPSGQILQLCDQINRQSSHAEQSAQVGNLPGPTSSGSVTNNVQPHNFNQNPQPNFQTASVAQQQQLQQPQTFNAAPIFYRSSQQPMCIFPQTVPQQVQLGQSLFVPTQFVNPVGNNNNAANRLVLVNGNAQQFGTTSPSGQGFIQLMSARSEQPAANKTFYCPYAAQDQIPAQAPVQTLPAQKSASQGLDSYYASFANRLASINVTNPFIECKTGETSCVNSNQCIPNEKWCNNVVDCRDASDETACSCTSRLNSEKLCDGYLDCPFGTDEIGCFGCAKNEYSCFSNSDEYQMSKFASGSMCYSLVQKCDGFTDCLNGRDEEECSMLIKDVALHTTFMVPYTEGILYRNFRGRWYPVCDDPTDWATDACEAEMDELSEIPLIRTQSGTLPGPFISKISHDDQLALSNQIRFSDTCPTNSQSRNQFYIWAKCPKLKCGTTKRLVLNAPTLRIRDENERKKRDEYLRIVGGDRSAPHNWPYIVAIYRNGYFHCGGTILTGRWIISAAHCVSRAETNYYEVQAGLLRRFSFAPEVQITKATHVIANERFNKNDMVNDVALLRLEKPLNFNRWVRPICLPSAERVTTSSDPNWMFGPSPNTICTVIGWGDLLEDGTSSDSLEEVNVPIMKTCKHIIDIDGNEICAGDFDGGRDACQGDSGGPLVCRSNADPNESYLAGIVSHGEGCARPDEPGVYTRVALYNDWITDMINSDLSITAKRTKSTCPGFTCIWSSKCISNHNRCNGIINCLGGEDELNCAFDPNTSARKRVGRHNADHVLPNGGGNSDIPHVKHTTEIPILLSTTMVQNIKTTTPMPHTTIELPTTAPKQNESTTPLQKHHTTTELSAMASELNESTTPKHKPHTTTELSTMASELNESTTSMHKPHTTTELSAIASELNESTTSMHKPHTTTELSAIASELNESTTPKHKPHTTTELSTMASDLNESTTPKHKPHTSTEPLTITPVFEMLTQAAEPNKVLTTPAGVFITTSPNPNVSQLDPVNDTENIGPSKDTDRRNTTLIDDFLSTTTTTTTTTTSGNGHVVHETTEKVPTNTTFECLEIPQTISMDFRCDGHGFDCEDGTDEKNCTCRETLHKKQAHLICDGKVDCLDGGDEEGCLACNTDEFSCPRSKKCIPKTSRCNKHTDCELREDEDDCYALTDGKSVVMDFESRPKLNHKGIVCNNINGTWSVKCVTRGDSHTNTEMADMVCFSLGFSGYVFFNLSRVDENGEIQTRRPPVQERNEYYREFLPAFMTRQPANFGRHIYKRSIDEVNLHQAIRAHEIFVEAPQKSCSAVYLECVPHSYVPPEEPDNAPVDQTTVNPEPITSPPTTAVAHTIEPIHPLNMNTTISPIEPNHSNHSRPAGNETELRIIEDNFRAPWLASIFIDGDFKCIGVLLDRQWIIVENNCVDEVNLDHNVIVAVLGKSQSIETPFEKIHRVTCDKKLKSGGGTLLFLPNAVPFDRYTLPTYIPSSIDDNDEDCLAVSHGQQGGFISIPVVRNDTDCPNDQKNCYQAIEPLEHVHCNDFDGASFGVVVCTDQRNNTYYPIAMFAHENGLCSFNDLMELELLEPSYSRLQLLINWPFCTYSKENVECEGHRCPLGKCIPDDHVCNGEKDCHDGSDETIELCREKGKCAPNELKCRDGGCIPKIRFCDGYIDCKDASDEPDKCPCRAYLALTDDSKICDGVPNCADKSDEHKCPCKQSSYKCRSSGECIPANFVCDGQSDCAGAGEDESACEEFGSQPTPAQSYYYQYNARSASDWHSMCYFKPEKPTKQYLVESCRRVGDDAEHPENILYQLIDSNEEPMMDEQSSNVNVIATNIMFSKLHLNNKFNLTYFHPRRKTTQLNNGIDCPYLLEFNCAS